MIENSELLRITAFANLPEDQIAWFISQSQELKFKAEDSYSHQGDPADSMYVILEGQVQARGEFGGETISFTMKAGDVTGVLPFSRMKQFAVNGRALTDTRLLKFPSAKFPDLMRGGQRPKGWTLDRDPFLLETNVPGLFAVGDVRHGSVKRVASGVGEGSVAVQFVHQYLSKV